MPIGPNGSIGPNGAICPIDANWANWFQRPNWRDMSYLCQLGQLDPSAQLALYVLCIPIGPIGSTGPIGAICTMYANWANWYHGPNWCDMSHWINADWANWFHRPSWCNMYYLGQLGQLVPRAQLVRFVPMNWCQLGQLVSSAQLARYFLLVPNGPICSTGPIGAMCLNELMPNGPICSTGPIGAICTMHAKWANWFHGPNWCDMSQWINANWANWFHRPNWRDMSYWCQLGQFVPLAQLAGYVLLMPIGPIGSTDPNGAICTMYIWFLRPNWCIMSQWIDANWANWFHRPNWRDMSYWCHLGQLVPRAQLARFVPMNWCQLGRLVPSAQLALYFLLVPIGPIGSTGPIGAICLNELMPIGPIGSIGPIGPICPIDANWANWFHGPNWRYMYYECQLGQLVPRVQLVRYVWMN